MTTPKTKQYRGIDTSKHKEVIKNLPKIGGIYEFNHTGNLYQAAIVTLNIFGWQVRLNNLKTDKPATVTIEEFIKDFKYIKTTAEERDEYEKH